jgi:hypothetical protein
MFVDALIEMSSAALSNDTPLLTSECASLAGGTHRQLEELLAKRNGFYAFASALHVFSASAAPPVVGLAQWNAPGAWRAEFGSLAHTGLFFAQDAVGGQFCLLGDAVQKFDPETGERTRIANDLEEWASIVLDDDTQTLWPLVDAWQRRHGALGPGKRLVPKVPFVLGGEFVVENLYAADAAKAMHLYAQIAKQVHNLPDGAQLEVRTIE